MKRRVDMCSEMTRKPQILVAPALSIGQVNKGQLTLIFEPSRTTESITVHFESDDKRMSINYNPLGRRTKLIGPEDIQ